MRILHAIGGLADYSGGPSSALVGLALAQAAKGDAVSIITGHRHGDITSREPDLRAALIDVLRVPRRSLIAELFSRLPQAVGKKVLDAEVVHIHGVWEPFLLAIAHLAASKRIPVIIRTCGMLDEWALARKRTRKVLYLKIFLSRMLTKAAALHCTSRLEARSTARQFPRARIIIEPNGIALDEFQRLPPRGSFRNNYSIGDAPLICFLGRVHPGKGVEYLLPAFAQLIHKDARLAIVGPDNGVFADQMKALARELGIASRVTFTGLLRGASRIVPLVDADLFALPSEHENFGVAVVEALAAGCPAIVSEDVGLADEIVAHEAGQATDRHPAQLAAALDEWLEDPARRGRASANARRLAISSYDWNGIATQWRTHYAALISGSLPACWSGN